MALGIVSSYSRSRKRGTWKTHELEACADTVPAIPAVNFKEKEDMTKPKDPDIIALKAADKAIRNTSERMRQATLIFLWNKYVLDPIRKAKNGI